MSKFPIQWHEDCLRNWKHTLDKERERIERMQRNYEQQLTEWYCYEDQITEAKRRGVDGFDRDRFMKERKKK